MSRVPLGVDSQLINKEVIDILEEEGVDPIRILAQFAKGDLAEDASQQLAAAKELAQYVRPKKRALDVNKEVKASVQFSVVRFSDVMPDEAKLISDQLQQMRADKLSLTNVTAKKLMKEVEKNKLNAVTIDAMRTDTERLVVDGDGLVSDGSEDV